MLEREVWKTISSVLLRPVLLRAGLEKMIESERELLAIEPVEQIAHWAEQVERSRVKRSRYQDQEAEGLMTRVELRAKLAELDETVTLAEAEIEKLRCHEERILALEKSGEELLERYVEIVPAELGSLSPGERRHIYQLLRVEVLVPKDGEIKIRLPFLPDDEGFCREETAHGYRLQHRVEACFTFHRRWDKAAEKHATAWGSFRVLPRPPPRRGARRWARRQAHR